VTAGFHGSVVALCGGVGGAKLALGLAAVVPAGRLTVVVNIGDDFDHFGLRVCPDIDTVLYTLGGVANAAQGWGRADESWRTMQAIDALGGDTWFNLGDTDLATHLVRTARLVAGDTLSAVTAQLARSLGIDAHIVPVSDARVRTLVETDSGVLPFQDYFVRHRCQPVVSGLRFAGAGEAVLSPLARAALAAPELAAIIICPSNPWLSIDPMLAITELRDVLERTPVPRVAVSPLIAGKAVKGPTAKIMTELGLPLTSASIAAHYRGLIDTLVIDAADAADADAVRALGCGVALAPTLMRTMEDKRALAEAVLACQARP